MIKKLRASQVIIDLPTETAPVWAFVTWQRCMKGADYKTVQTVDAVSTSNRSLQSFMLQMHTIIDPVTGQTVTLSGAAVASAIKAFVQQWKLEEIPGSYVNEHNDLIEP